MSDFALIIPTHNRNIHVNAIVKYYLSYGFNGKIYVIDSSALPNTNLAGKKEIEYLHYPDMAMTKKISLGLEKVTEKFCLLNADDDYYSIGFISKAQNILSTSTDYSCVYGVNYGYIANKNIGIKTYPISYHCLKSHALSNDLSQRIKNHFTFYNPLMYVAMHTQDLKDAYSIMNSENILNYNIQEFIITTVNLIKGKACYLSQTFCFRESVVETKILDTNKNDVLRKDIPELMAEKDENYTKAVSALAKYNAKTNPGTTVYENEKMIGDGFKAFVEKFIPFAANYKIELPLKNRIALRIIKSFSGSSLLGLDKKFYNELTAYELLSVALVFFKFHSHFNPVNKTARKEVLQMMKILEERISINTAA